MRVFLLGLHARSTDFPLIGSSAEQVWQRYKQILDQAEQEDPPPESKKGKGRAKNTPGRNLLRRLQQYEAAVLAFVFVDGVRFPTTKQSEICNRQKSNKK